MWRRNWYRGAGKWLRRFRLAVDLYLLVAGIGLLAAWRYYGIEDESLVALGAGCLGFGVAGVIKWAAWRREVLATKG